MGHYLEEYNIQYPVQYYFNNNNIKGGRGWRGLAIFVICYLQLNLLFRFTFVGVGLYAFITICPPEYPQLLHSVPLSL